eukprot:CAMPEP_0118953582 /NCGR_PEP_ID=MMETSP1169-20130426/56834_1 /TAXON_ID=36882 /ORGANISM="Pyramimonas obovata, Strain CCMP722" /LENGTH=195 /DNA_ID=CAMNT_0006901083 /DNA_START=152 /DNA_END=736 /DNA_ORIENTATION=+
MCQDPGHGESFASPDPRWCCAICYDVLLDPVTLPCGHTFDSSCIAELVSRSAPGILGHRCPNCRADLPHVMPEVSRNVREMVECVFPEAVARRRAEEAKAAATDALHTAIFCEPGPALLKRQAHLVRQDAAIENLRKGVVLALEQELALLARKMGALSAEEDVDAVRTQVLDVHAHVRLMAVRMALREGVEVNAE